MKKFRITRTELHLAYADVSYIVEAATKEDAEHNLDVTDAAGTFCFDTFEFDEFCDGNPEDFGEIHSIEEIT